MIGHLGLAAVMGQWDEVRVTRGEKIVQLQGFTLGQTISTMGPDCVIGKRKQKVSYNIAVNNTYNNCYIRMFYFRK